jgi:uncharacterized protein (DUF697 family)
MGGFRLTSKVKATIIFAIITFLATTFGLDLDKQTETLINALVPVIVGYLWVESWDKFVPNLKILAAAISAVIVYVAFRLGIELSKPVENFINAAVPVLVAWAFPSGRFGESVSESSQDSTRVR